MNCDREVLARPMAWEYQSDLFRICVPANLLYIGVARRAVEALGEQIGLTAEECSALKLAVGEACNNAVQYGNPEGVDRELRVVCRVVTEAVEIDVISEGSGFYPVPGDITMPTPESLAESGRGLALIELMMDSVEYFSLNGNDVVRMRKQLAPPAHAGKQSFTETRQEPQQ